MSMKSPEFNYNQDKSQNKNETLKTTPETYPDKKYWERRNLIEISDEEIIREGRRESHNFQDSMSRSAVFGFIKDNIEMIKNYTKGKTFFDIGCGKDGVFNANIFLGRGKNGIDLGVSDVVLVDLYSKPNEDEIANIKSKQIKFEKNDALSFLISQNFNAGCYFMSHIEYSLIPCAEYHQRIAQEIYRTMPEDGIFISNGCYDIEKEAEELFSVNKSMDGFGLFMKKELSKKE